MKDKLKELIELNKELIDVIEGIATATRYTSYLDFYKLKERAKQLQSEQEEGWISVEDRLPEYGKYVLVLGVDRMMYDKINCHVCEMNDLEDGIDFKESGQFYWLTESGRKIDKVTYWMPLPKSPSK